MGPACRDPSVLRRVIEAGADVVRLNLSHGTLEDHRAVLETLLALEREHGLSPAVMMDTGGPEVRVEGLGDDGLLLTPGQEVWVGEGPDSAFQVSDPGFLREAPPGTAVLLADGEMRLRVVEGGDPARLRVEVGGVLDNHKKVACPDLRLDLPLLSEADLAALELGWRLRLDWVAASFIRDPADVFFVKQALEAMGADVPVMAKIERKLALDNLADIVRVADGIMVARGDLGVEVAAEQLPWWQKRIIQEANAAGKPVVTATEMLESMVTHGRPTRAEVTDVANAIWDGTDAVMLSAETAAGRYPVEAVETMARIAAEADARARRGAREEIRDVHSDRDVTQRLSVTAAVSHATVTAAVDLDAAAIVAATESGHTALAVARLRPNVPVVAVTPHEAVARRLKVVWGVDSYVMPPVHGTDQLMERAVAVALEAGRIRPGDLVVVIAGVPSGQPGTTNLMRVVTVGEAILRGQGMGPEQSATAPVLVVEDVRAVSARQVAGKVLVARATNRDWVPLIEQAAALVVEEGGLTSHAAVVGLSLGKPTIVGATDATRRLSSGQIVTVDARRGLVYQGAARV